MRILIIGGSLFVGKHITQSALENNIEIIHFNRGHSNRDGFPNVKTILGDRTSEIEKVGNQQWDAVIDTCGYFPEDVAKSAEFFKEKSHYYLFISSISAYADFSKRDMNEDAKLAELQSAHQRKITAENYGALKALCEKEVQSRFRERAIIIRAGYITGPDDYSDRFTFWMHQFLHYNPIISPQLKDAQIQFIDVRDLAIWILHLLKSKKSGIYNATNKVISFKKMLTIMRDIVQPNTEIVELTKDFIEKKKIPVDVYFPLWLDPELKEVDGINFVSIERAIDTKIRFRNFSETFYDMWHWFLSQNRDELRVGFKSEDYNLLSGSDSITNW